MNKKITGGILLFAACVVLLYAKLRILGGICPFRLVTGIPCPGCGMTRAVLAACRGDMTAAFAYHPLFPLLPLVALLLLCAVAPGGVRRVTACLHIDERRFRQIETVIAAVLTVLFLGVYVIRLLWGWRG